MRIVQALSLIALECPECGLTTEEFLGDLAKKHNQECSACGAIFQISPDEIPGTVGLTRSLLPGAMVFIQALKGLLVEARPK